VTVTLRPVRMERFAVSGPQRFRGFEKGVDVLCALALIRLASAAEVDLVILASHDSDLKPALDDAIDVGKAGIETCAWFHPRFGISFRQLRPHPPRFVRHTRLDVDDFKAAHDPTVYH
jgi:hypothetical protein